MENQASQALCNPCPPSHGAIPRNAAPACRGCTTRLQREVGKAREGKKDKQTRQRTPKDEQNAHLQSNKPLSTLLSTSVIRCHCCVSPWFLLIRTKPRLAAAEKEPNRAGTQECQCLFWDIVAEAGSRLMISFVCSR